MILSNLTKAIREQNYYAVVLEFLIVIAGVVIGFQIQGWSETQRDLRAGQAAMDSLVAETHQNVRYLEDHVSQFDGFLVEQEASIAALAQGVMPPDMTQDSFVQGISLVRRFRPPEPPKSVYETLIATGEIRLIQNREVLESLADYHSSVRSMQAYADRISQSMTAQQPRYHPAIVSIYDPDEDFRRRRQADFDQLANDPEFLNDSVNMLRANIAVHNERRLLLEAARHLLDVLCQHSSVDTCSSVSDEGS